MSLPITVELPDDALAALRLDKDAFAEALKQAAVCKWYELGRVSQSRAAELLGVSRARLFEILAAHGTEPIQATEAELEEEVRRG